MVNIRDVAEKAGVSVTTVSRVINNNAPVKEKTRVAVEKAMKELDYLPNQLARGMRTKRSNTIGIIIPEFINTFYHELFQYIEEEACKEGYKILVSSTGKESGNEINDIKDFVSRRIDGIIICTYKGDKQMIEYLTDVDRKTPIVFLDNIAQHFDVNAVYTDGYGGMKELVSHLVGKGHRKVAFIRGLNQYNVANDRYAGYVDAVKANKMELRKEWIFEGDYHIESGYCAAKYFIEECSFAPTAIIASSDLMAIGAINYLLSKDIRIPDEVAVAGFDDILLSRLTVPPLTTVSQPMKEIAREAVGMITYRIKHSEAKNRKSVLKGQLKVRHSTDISKSKVIRLEI